MQRIQRSDNALLTFVNQVFSFLPSTEDYASYRSIFIHEEISPDIAMDLDDEALEEIGISKKIHRSKILKTISKILDSMQKPPSSRPPGVIGSKVIHRDRSKTPPGLYMNGSSPPTTKTPERSQRGEPDYIPGQARMFFTNMQYVKSSDINWEVTLERYFSQFGQNVDITYMWRQKLAFIELVVDPEHTSKFPSKHITFTHHTVRGHKLSLKVATHKPYGPSTKPDLHIKVGGRVAGYWNGKYLPATVCEVQNDQVFVLFDGYEGFKEMIARKSIKHVSQIDKDTDTARSHDWKCPKCANVCFGSKPLCPRCGEPSPVTNKRRGLRVGMTVTCSFGDTRHEAIVTKIAGMLVFVRRPKSEENEPTTFWDIEMVDQIEGRSLISTPPGPGTIGPSAPPTTERQRIEQSIRAWIQAHPHACLPKLCSNVKIPYQDYGFETATLFLKAMNVNIGPHPRRIVSLGSQSAIIREQIPMNPIESDSSELRKKIEAEVVRWVSQNPGGFLNMLCVRVKIPYLMLGYKKPSAFVRSISAIKCLDNNKGATVLHLASHNVPDLFPPSAQFSQLATKDELKEQIINSVKIMLKDTVKYSHGYIPYPFLLQKYDKDAKNLGYTRLLDFIEKDMSNELEVKRQPDARIFLKKSDPFVTEI